MNIIISAGQGPSCSVCKKPLESWNPLIKNEKCIPCTADEISTAMIKIVKEQYDKIKIKNGNSK